MEIYPTSLGVGYRAALIFRERHRGAQQSGLAKNAKGHRGKAKPATNGRRESERVPHRRLKYYPLSERQKERWAVCHVIDDFGLRILRPRDDCGLRTIAASGLMAIEDRRLREDCGERRCAHPRSSLNRRSSMVVSPEAAKSSIPQSQVNVTGIDPLAQKHSGTWVGLRAFSTFNET